MVSFFQDGNCPCKIYERTRDATDKWNSLGREFMNDLWRECQPFVDPDCRQRATQNMPVVFWELYVASALQRLGIAVQPQHRTKQNKRGPDLYAINPEVWIEAVVAQMGTGPDAMECDELGKCTDMPVTSFILRLRNAFEVKARVFSEYIKGGLVKPTQGTVIAISGAMLPTAHSEYPIPRIVRAMLGVGNIGMNIGVESGAIESVYVEHQGNVDKVSGSPVKTDPFLDPAYSHISAVLYSCSDWVNRPDEPGSNLVLIHNQHAAVRVPHGWLKAGVEYWREHDQLQSSFIG